MTNQDQKQKITTDMRELRKVYMWSNQEVEDIKQAASDNSAWWRYWQIMAAAHRAGYVQHHANNFMRIQQWCAENGISDPFAEGFDMAEFND